ncbi:hypothetical protein M5K25_026611 [Dendrobium thyrsiflorum]|uniref:Uncharacterized protein n=1 Tax=Dendrobium thyrsiflorum TaxID=117978 RepID=A0ABD0TXM5_DENTH
MYYLRKFETHLILLQEIQPNFANGASSREWDLCLVGYTIGRRPYYEALISVKHRFDSKVL